VVKFSLEQDVQADFVPDIDSSCIPYTATLANRSYNGDVYYYKSPGGSFIQDEPQQIVVDQTGDQEYIIVALDTTCGFSDTISLTLYGFVDSLDADFTSDHDSCENEYVVNFTNLSLHASSYYWDFGDGDFSTDISPTHDFKEDGTYVVNMFVTSDICSKVDTVTQSLVFKSRSSQGRFLTNYEACRDGTVAQFIALGTGFKNYIWSVNGVKQADSTFFKFDFETFGSYTITLESIDSACGIFIVEEEVIEIEEDDREVHMPNFFSPNNDNENELFGPLGEFGEDYFLEFNMTIYNRWGIELYRSSHEQLKWDGTFNGNNLDEGVYYYLVSYKDICGNDDELTGFVHLFR
jgi:gliding motility-associated-like protein